MDAQEVFFLRSDPEVNKYVKRSNPKDLKEAEEFITKVTTGTKENKNIYWAISLRSQSTMIGSICLWNFSEDLKIGEVGFDLNPNYQAKGYMSEALKKIIDFGFNNLNLDIISAYTHRNNTASIHLLNRHQFVHQIRKTDSDNSDNIILELNKVTLK